MKLYIFQQLWVSNEKWFKTQWTRNSFYHTYMQIPAPICKENILDIHTHTSQHKSWSIYLHAVVYLKSLKKGKLSRQWLACSSLHFVARKSVSREFCISMAKCVRCQFQANTSRICIISKIVNRIFRSHFVAFSVYEQLRVQVATLTRKCNSLLCSIYYKEKKFIMLAAEFEILMGDTLFANMT